MPVELYTANETGPAKDAVAELARHLPEPFVLAGGWGVWATVTDRFQAEQGTPYLGSRDADYGFTINPTWTLDELRESTYARALAKIQDLGYLPSGTTRYCRWIHHDTGRNLTEAEARRLPTHDLVQLFVDPMVDVIHPRHHDVFNVKPLDSPLLGRVFSEAAYRVETTRFGPKIWLPHPSTLLAMKFESFPERNKDDKAIKDLCDAYALAWHSGERYRALVKVTRERHPEQAAKARHMTESPFLDATARHVGASRRSIVRVLKEFHVGTSPS